MNNLKFILNTIFALIRVVSITNGFTSFNIKIENVFQCEKFCSSTNFCHWNLRLQSIPIKYIQSLTIDSSLRSGLGTH